MLHTAIFLGAGASCAEGAPSQAALFRDYFSSVSFRDSHDEMDRELAQFFWEMFQVDVYAPDVTKLNFPTFEEVLGLTDLAILRKESFKNFDIENRAANSGRLRFIAQYLVFLVAKVLDDRLQHRAEIHRRLVTNLREADQLRRVAFVSTNYDILIDNALDEQYDQGFDLDYGVAFRNFERAQDWRPPRKGKGVPLFKPHGSLNWLFCPTCNELEFTPNEKGVTRLISYTANAACQVCGSIFAPLIVPPTFYKDFSNAFLSYIWNRTGTMLRRVEHIVFCGYSFPDADTHIKYLLKRAQTNRSYDTPLRITVINNHKGKDKQLAKQEQERYFRFLGPSVNYTELSFDQFANDPLQSLLTTATRT